MHVRLERLRPAEHCMPEHAAYLTLRCDAAVGSIRLKADVSLQHAWTTVFGPSGSGKSSLLRVMAGLLKRERTTLTLYGHDLSILPAHQRSVGFVTQPPALFPHLSVLQNIRFGQNPSGCEDVERLLQRFQLHDLRSKRVQVLSGGETQRVAVARALYPRPSLLLIDEGFSGLDRATRTGLIAALRDIQRERSAMHPLPILAVTHDVAEVFETADEVLRMRDGSIVNQGSPEQVLAEERHSLLAQLHRN